MDKEKKQTKISRIILILIILLSFFLRVWKIEEYPAGLNADEAAIGYNAYSLLKTGRDEFNHPWPINFQSFNDYKPGLYFYLVLPFVKIFGLRELSVRLPSVILGTLMVWLMYLFSKQLFKNEKLSLLTSLLAGICPWLIFFSRGGWESNAATFFILLGAWLFFKGLYQPKLFIFSLLSFLFSMYTYHSARVVTPILILGMIFLYFKKIFKKENSKSIIIVLVLSLIISLPLLKSFFSQEGTSRFSGVGIFADEGPFWRTNELRGQHSNPFSPILKPLHNKYFEYSLQFVNNYLKHFNGDFLFISGDEIQRNRVPESGQLLLIGLPFLLLGISFFLRKRPQNWQLMFWWLGVSPIASSLTFQSPHAIRSLSMVIPLTIITAYGLYNFISWIKGKMPKIMKLLYVFLGVSFVWNFSFFLHQYFVHYPKTYPSAWEYGFRQLADYLSVNQDKYDNIYITNKYDQPYILLAFFLNYPPDKFQQEAVLTPRDQYGFSTVENFGKYHFTFNSWDEASGLKLKGLFIGTPEQIPDSATIVKRIYFKDGKKEAFRIVER